MRRLRLPILAVLTVAALVGIGPAQAAVAYGSEAEFRGRALTPTVYTRSDGRSCTVSSAAAGLEYGKHGVTRFKIKYELRGPNDPGYLPTYQSTPYFYSGRFRDDISSRYYTLSLSPNTFVFGADKQFSVWVKIVGDRSWRRDFTRHFKLGDVMCSTTVDEETPDVYDEGGQIVEGGA
jgi:hypothetical protein